MTRLKVPAWKLLRVSRKGERYPVPGGFFSKKDAEMVAKKRNDGRGKWADRFVVVPRKGYDDLFKR